jgi:DNA-directed RNA polymerase subunit K/omega
MRSEYVFAAAKEIQNRFLLCRVTSVSARRLQIGSKQAAETINQSLRLIASSELGEETATLQHARKPAPAAANATLDAVVAAS